MSQRGFTLVELIVVVTILTLLSAIGFVSYSSYLLEARDANRIAALTSISDGFQLHQAKKSLVIPDRDVEIKSGGKLIGWQGYVGKRVLESIGYTKGGVDPLDGDNYSYFLAANKRNYQFLAFLEKKESIETRGFEAYNTYQVFTDSIEYYDRFPKTYGSPLGIMTDLNNTPLQEVKGVKKVGYLDIFTTTGSYMAYYDDKNKIQGDHTVLSSLSPLSSCARMKDFLGRNVSGIYTINPTGVVGNKYDVYCEMELGGGGWTLVATSADDGQSTWTYDNRALLHDNSDFGNVSEYTKDFKSKAFSDITFTDMMFIDKQKVWGVYVGVQPLGDKTVAEFSPTELTCAYQGTGRAYYMTSGSILKNQGADGEQQDRALMFNVYDNEEGCTLGSTPTGPWKQHAYGPTWSYRQNTGTAPDDPGLMGWGPVTGADFNIGSAIHQTEGGNARLGKKFLVEGETNDGDYILWFIR